MRLKLNVALGGKKSGEVIDVATDTGGTIIDQYWRRRLADAAIDNCVEIVDSKVDIKKEKTK